MILEVCIDSIESAMAAKAGGADRLEICSSLSAGGTTPSVGLIRQCIEQTGLPAMVMIRPHDGEFVYSESDIETMLLDIETANSLRVTGVVFGCLNGHGSIEMNQCRRLLEAAGDLETTFHRAFDVGHSPLEMLDQLIELGFDRVLTSGQAESAQAGSELIAELVQRATGKISILAGAGVTPKNALAIVKATGVSEIHASASVASQSVSGSADVSRPVQFGQSRRVTSADIVRAIKDAVESANG